MTCRVIFAQRIQRIHYVATMILFLHVQDYWLYIAKSNTNTGCHFNHVFDFWPTASSSVYAIKAMTHPQDLWDTQRQQGILICLNTFFFFASKHIDTSKEKPTYVKATDSIRDFLAKYPKVRPNLSNSNAGWGWGWGWVAGRLSPNQWRAFQGFWLLQNKIIFKNK